MTNDEFNGHVANIDKNLAFLNSRLKQARKLEAAAKILEELKCFHTAKSVRFIVDQIAGNMKDALDAGEKHKETIK